MFGELINTFPEGFCNSWLTVCALTAEEEMLIGFSLQAGFEKLQALP